MLQTIFESNPMAITVVDRNGFIKIANSAAENILRLTRTEISQRCYDAPEWTITDLTGNPFPVENLPFVIAKSTLAPVYNVRHAISHDGNERILTASSHLSKTSQSRSGTQSGGKRVRPPCAVSSEPPRWELAC